MTPIDLPTKWTAAMWHAAIVVAASARWTQRAADPTEIRLACVKSQQSITTARRTGRVRATALVCALCTVVLSACGDDETTSAPTSASGLSDTADVPDTLTTTASSGEAIDSAMQAAVVASVLSGALAGGIQLDEACVAGVVAQLNATDLAAIAASLENPGGEELTLSPEAEALTDDLGDCATDGDTLPLDPVEAIEDVCAHVDVDVLSQLHSGLGDGEAIGVSTMWGDASTCEFHGADDSRVTVYVTRNADVNAWSDEATDGDGLSDGELRRGIGQLAVVGVGYAGAVVGDTTLIEVSAFPAMELEADVLVQVLSDIVDGYPY